MDTTRPAPGVRPGGVDNWFALGPAPADRRRPGTFLPVLPFLPHRRSDSPEKGRTALRGVQGRALRTAGVRGGRGAGSQPRTSLQALPSHALACVTVQTRGPSPRVPLPRVPTPARVRRTVRTPTVTTGCCEKETRRRRAGRGAACQAQNALPDEASGFPARGSAPSFSPERVARSGLK